MKISAAISYPGLSNDGGIAMDFIPFLKEKLLGRNICVDQDFP